jgi:hypothetical protein
MRLTVIALALATLPAATLQADEWIPLFNGKDLDGWKVKIKGYELGQNFANTFRVEDGVLKVSYDGYEEFGGRFGHLFHEREFSDYLLRVEYRFTGEQVRGGPDWAVRNSGVMLHGERPEGMRKDQDFPVSIEVQLLGGDGAKERTTANLCTPGTNVVMDGKLVTRHCTSSTSKTYHGDQWVTVLVEVRGNRITHIVDGHAVLAYTDPQLDERDADARRLLAASHPKLLRKGTISLQSESHPVEFRRVEIQVLTGAAVASAEPAPAAGWVDLLEGNDLSKRWKTSGNWKIDAEGVVTLAPRPGETGWSRFGDYLWLDGEHRDFEIEFDYRVEPRGNSGFYLHVGDRKSPVATGIEVQIYDSGGKAADAKLSDHDSGGIIPGLPPAKNAAMPAGEWNRFHITVHANKLVVRLNGEVVNELPLDHPRIKDRPPSGAIGFQDHALPLALRRIRMRELAPAAR